MLKRCFDFVSSVIGLVLLSPLLLAIVIWIKVDSEGPVFFRQERVGRFGRTFLIHKFRTMIVDADAKGPQITIGKDRRVTRAGNFLRKLKLDELPQLIDVLYGKMSIVGPRPEVPRYIALYPDEVKAKVLSVRPGITDWASIRFKDENDILARSNNPEDAYVREVLPIKQRYYVEYVESNSFLGDLTIIFATLGAILKR